MYVPTRHEVATLPVDRLSFILDFWMWESPSELIPNDAQIGEVRAILETRPDAEDAEMRTLIAQCDDFLRT
jgi:hypothetical protein